ncbi:MAG: substrate-binding domain-containing protein [Planctomycetales bacterium]
MKRCLLPLLLLAAVPGCGSSVVKTVSVNSTAGVGSDPDMLQIAVIPKGTSHVFWKSIHAGAAKAAKEEGVEIFWKGPAQENNTDEQISTVQNFIAREVDGICLAPNDSQSLVPAVEEAKEAGVPTVVFDSGLSAPDGLIVSYVATDNFNGGALGARRLAELLNNEGDVILLRYQVGSESTRNARRDSCKP